MHACTPPSTLIILFSDPISESAPTEVRLASQPRPVTAGNRVSRPPPAASREQAIKPGDRTLKSFELTASFIHQMIVLAAALLGLVVASGPRIGPLTQLALSLLLAASFLKGVAAQQRVVGLLGNKEVKEPTVYDSELRLRAKRQIQALKGALFVVPTSLILETCGSPLVASGAAAGPAGGVGLNCGAQSCGGAPGTTGTTWTHEHRTEY
jgi:hypothetical protein